VDTGKATPTMNDVAAFAGVSHQTVSRVLNGEPFVSEATRQKVLAAVEALKYRRNMMAKALVTGSTNVIGVLVTDPTMTGPSGAVLAIERTARARGYWLSLASVERHEDTDETARAVSHFVDQGVDGIIAVAQTQVVVDEILRVATGIPTVLVTSGVVPPGHATIDIDQAGGSRALLDLLRGLGHTRIAHVMGPPGDLHGLARYEEWRRSLAPDQPTDGLLVAGDWSSISGYEATLALLDASTPATAIVAANDQMALGATRALSEHGLRVPDDMSVVGFDDIDASNCAIPPLTTIRQNHRALGAATLALLLDVIGGQPVRNVTIPAELIVRKSAAPPPDRR